MLFLNKTPNHKNAFSYRIQIWFIVYGGSLEEEDESEKHIEARIGQNQCDIVMQKNNSKKSQINKTLFLSENGRYAKRQYISVGY